MKWFGHDFGSVGVIMYFSLNRYNKSLKFMSLKAETIF